MHAGPKHIIKIPNQLFNPAIKRFLELIDAVIAALGIIMKGDPLEIVGMASCFYGPLDHFPLHQIIGHYIAMLVRGGTVEITGFSAIIDSNGSRDRLAIVVTEIQPSIQLHAIQNTLKVRLRPRDKAIPLGGDFIETVKLPNMGFILNQALDAMTHGQPDIIPAFAVKATKDFFRSFPS